jgi:hypothetical protein
MLVTPIASSNSWAGDYYTASGGPNGGGIKLSLPYSVSTTTSLYVYAEDNSRVLF